METNFFFSRDSEAAFGAQSATMGGSFWTRIRLGMAGPGVRGQDDRDNLFFSRDSEAASGTQSATMGGSFWIRIRLGKAVAGPGVRGQDDRDKWKQTSFFLGIQRRRLAPKVRPREARFGPELDWEKLWRDQVFGAKMTETNGNKLLFSRDSEAAFGTQSATMGGSFWTRIRLGKAVAGPGVRGQDDRDKWKQAWFFLGIQRPKVRPCKARFGCSGPR